MKLVQIVYCIFELFTMVVLHIYTKKKLMCVVQETNVDFIYLPVHIATTTTIFFFYEAKTLS